MSDVNVTDLKKRLIKVQKEQATLELALSELAVKIQILKKTDVIPLDLYKELHYNTEKAIGLLKFFKKEEKALQELISHFKPVKESSPQVYDIREYQTQNRK